MKGEYRFTAGSLNKAKNPSFFSSVGQVIAFFLVDTTAESMQSIRNVKKVVYDEAGKMSVQPYLDNFPFPFYAVLEDVSSLPETIADALRQWFELVNSSL